jgi:Domain of unknown function (DUF4352)
VKPSRTIPAAVGAALIAAALSGCAAVSSSVSTTPAKTAANAPMHTAAAKKAGLGDTIDITGMNGERLALTLVKVVPDAKGSDEFNTPDSGKVFFAAQIRITNIAKSAVYSDSPDNCMVVADGQGQQFQTDLSTISAGPGFDTVNLAPGSKALGYEVFQVPKGDKVTEIQYTIDSGMGSGTAQWSLG